MEDIYIGHYMDILVPVHFEEIENSYITIYFNINISIEHSLIYCFLNITHRTLKQSLRFTMTILRNQSLQMRT